MNKIRAITQSLTQPFSKIMHFKNDISIMRDNAYKMKEKVKNTEQDATDKTALVHVICDEEPVFSPITTFKSMCVGQLQPL